MKINGNKMKTKQIIYSIAAALATFILFLILVSSTVSASTTPLDQNTSLSIAGPYVGSLVYDSPASGVNNQYGLDTGKQSRVRQNGYINAVQFAIANANKVNRFNVCIWRRNDDTGKYNLVAKSNNLTPDITTSGIQNIFLSTPLYAHEGDYIGWEANSVDTTNLIMTSKVPAGTTDAKIHWGTARTFSVGDEYDFVNSSTYHVSNKTYRLNIFMSTVDTAFIGDSVVSGRPVHTSYVDPAAYYNPWSSMSYWWGLYSGRTYQNLGWRGQTTAEIKNRFYADAIALHPSNVFIQGGLNDWVYSINKTTTLSNLCWMVNETVANGSHAYLCEIPPSTGSGNAINWADWQWINNQLKTIYANNSSVTLIPIRNYVGQKYASGPAGNLWEINTAYDGGDGLHYNIVGYQKFASVIYNYHSNRYTADVINGTAPLSVHFSILSPTILNSSLPTLAGWSRSAAIEPSTKKSLSEYIYIPKYPDMKADSSDVRFFLSNGTILPSQYQSTSSGVYFIYRYAHPANAPVYCAWGNNSALNLTQGTYFEDGESTANWTNMSGGMIESSAARVYSGNHSFKYTDLSATTYNDDCTFMLPVKTTNATVEWYANPSQNNTYSRLTILDGNASLKKGPWTVFGDNGQIQYWDGTSYKNIKRYSAGNWYRFKLVVKSGTKYDLYVDDTLVASDINTLNPATAYDRVVLFGYNVAGSSCYYDNINITVPVGSVAITSNISYFTIPSTSLPNIYSWNFGDGINSTEQNPTHTYSTAGNYTVSLTVKNAVGNNALTKYEYIRVAPSFTHVTYFEDGESTANWTNMSGGMIGSSAARVYSGNHSFKYTDLSATTYNDDCTFMLPVKTTNATVEWYANPSQNNTYSRLTILDGNASLKKGPWTVFGNNGQIQYWDGTSYKNIKRYSAGNWYHFKLVVKSGTKYDLYVDDTLVASDINTLNPATAYDRVVIFGFNVAGSSCYYDNINITVPRG